MIEALSIIGTGQLTDETFSHKLWFIEVFCSSLAIFWSYGTDENFLHNCEQAGTGPSRRHIQGSKIAKRLPSVKYSFTVVENRKFFEIFF